MKRNIKSYEALKDKLRKKFRQEKLGEQAQKEEVTNLFLPVTKTLARQTEVFQEGQEQQKKQLKAIQDKNEMQLQILQGSPIPEITPPMVLSRKRIMSTPLPKLSLSYHEKGTPKQQISFDEFDPLAVYGTPMVQGAEGEGDLSAISGEASGDLIGDEEEEDEEVFSGDISKTKINLGPLAKFHLSKYARKGNTGDPVFGIRYEEGEKDYFVGNKRVRFDGDDIVIGNKRYVGNHDLWELLTSKNVKPFKQYTTNDINTYYDILFLTSAVHRGNTPSGKVKSSSGFKYTEIIKPYWELLKEQESKPKSGTGVPKSGKGLRYYDNPNDLCDRLIMLLASRDAGNNSHNDEIIHIFKELKDTGFLSPDEYFAVLQPFGKCG